MLGVSPNRMGCDVSNLGDPWNQMADNTTGLVGWVLLVEIWARYEMAVGGELELWAH